MQGTLNELSVSSPSGRTTPTCGESGWTGVAQRGAWVRRGPLLAARRRRERDRPVIAYGDASFSPSGKGEQAVPTRGMAIAASRHGRLVMVVQHDQVLPRVRVGDKKSDVPRGRRESRGSVGGGLLRCESNACRSARDYHAARIIACCVPPFGRPLQLQSPGDIVSDTGRAAMPIRLEEPFCTRPLSAQSPIPWKMSSPCSKSVLSAQPRFLMLARMARMVLRASDAGILCLR